MKLFFNLYPSCLVLLLYTSKRSLAWSSLLPVTIRCLYTLIGSISFPGGKGSEEPRTGHSAPDLSHQCWTERKYHFPQPSGSIPSNAAQNTFGCLCCKVHCWVMVNLLSTRSPRTFSADLLYSWSVPSMCWCMIIHPQVPDFVFAFVELR